MKMFEYCPNVEPENHPPVSGGSDAVAAGEARFRSKLHGCHAKSLSPLLAWDSTLPEESILERPTKYQLEDILIRPLGGTA